MDRIQLPQGYRIPTKRPFTFTQSPQRKAETTLDLPTGFKSGTPESVAMSNPEINSCYVN